MMNTEITENGAVIVTREDERGREQWTCADPQQAVKHLPTWTDEKRGGGLDPIITPGDASAIADCHADAVRQVEETGSYTPTASWVYKRDGTVVQTRGVPVADAPLPSAEELATEPSLLDKLLRFVGIK